MKGNTDKSAYDRILEAFALTESLGTTLDLLSADFCNGANTEEVKAVFPYTCRRCAALEGEAGRDTRLHRCRGKASLCEKRIVHEWQEGRGAQCRPGLLAPTRTAICLHEKHTISKWKANTKQTASKSKQARSKSELRKSPLGLSLPVYLKFFVPQFLPTFSF